MPPENLDTTGRGADNCMRKFRTSVRRWAAGLLAFLAPTLFAAGCWGRRELEDIAFIALLGLDAVRDEEGRPLPAAEAGIEMTAGVALPRLIAQVAGAGRGGGTEGGGGGQMPMVILGVVAPNMTAGANALDESPDRVLSVTHLQALLVGEDLARQGLEDVLDQVLRYRNFRHTIPIAITEGRARDFIESFSTSVESAPWTYVRKLVVLTADGRVSASLHVHDLLVSHASKSSDAALVLLRTHKEMMPSQQQGAAGRRGAGAGGQQGGWAGQQRSSAVIVGTAAFRDARMVGKLDVMESIHMLMLRGDLKRALVSYPIRPGGGVISDSSRVVTAQAQDAGAEGEGTSSGVGGEAGAGVGERPPRPGSGMESQVGIEWEGAKIKKKVEVEGADGCGGSAAPKVRIVVEARVQGSITEVPKWVDVGTKEGIRELERVVAEDVRSRMEMVIAKAQTELEGADLFAFGDAVRRKFKTWGEWEAFDWPERFREAVVEVNVEVKLARPGLTVRNVWGLKQAARRLLWKPDAPTSPVRR